MEPSRSLPSVAGEVEAIVVTYRAPHALESCLTSIAGQVLLPAETLVIDNGSSVDESSLASLANAQLVTMPNNSGPAGGHAEGLRRFLQTDRQWAWMMDDDCFPHADVLSLLLEEARRAKPSLLFPTRRDAVSGRVENAPAWCGFLIHRDIVAAVGLPREDFFWWAEDTEYLHWRIPSAGFPVTRVHEAVVEHRKDRRSEHRPPWKIYYETRNSIHYRLRIQRAMGHRFYRLWRTLSRTLFSVITVRENRRQRLAAFAAGLKDGFKGRLGKTFDVGD